MNHKLFVGVFVGVFLMDASALARSVPPGKAPLPTNPTAAPARARPTRQRQRPQSKAEARARALENRLGLSIAERLLHSDEASDRVRALERLGVIGSARSLELLVRAVEPNGAAGTSRERLIAVRALAPHAHSAQVRQSLVRLMTSSTTRGSELADSLETHVRQSAALALAASHRPEALFVLGKALHQTGPIAEAAALAVEAHPPPDISGLLGARGMPSVALARAFAQLADQRAFLALRNFVMFGVPDVRAEAAVALTRLGALETVELARHWLKTESHPELLMAAAEILALSHASDWPEALSRLLKQPSTQQAALSLALKAPHPALVEPLLELLAESQDDEPELITALARAGGAKAARSLSRELASKIRGATAAYALSLMPGDEATEELERALSSRSTERMAARASVVRYAALRKSVSGLTGVLERLFASKNAADRAVGAWGLSVLDKGRAPDWLKSQDSAVVRAVARTALYGEAAKVAALRLGRERDPITRSALAICLVTRDAADRVPTRELELLVEEGGAPAPLAARALAMRDDHDLRPRLEALLESPDMWLRSHVALGLAYSRDPSAVGLLARAYRFEASGEVRRAIVAALSARSEKTRFATLRLAAVLDSDKDTRENARIALSGRRLGQLGRGSSSFWLSLTSNSDASAVAGVIQLGTAPGLALPAVADPDGPVVLTGLPAGPVTLRLADTPERNNAWVR